MSAQLTTSSTHPLLPPTTEEERLNWLRLLRSRRVGISTFYRLMGEHGNAARALDALPEIANKAGLSKYEVCSKEYASAEMALGHAAGAHLISVRFAAGSVPFWGNLIAGFTPPL